jgi:alpha-tubulin suppressor-like RCC1 family protein
VVAGQYHSFAISSKGEMYGWGYNRDYELGVGDNMDRVLPQAVTAPQGHKVRHTHLGRRQFMGVRTWTCAYVGVRLCVCVCA